MLFEQTKGNRIPRGDVPRVVRMQMVSAIVGGKDSRGQARIPHHGIEIDDTVEFTAFEYPVVDLLTYSFFLRSKERDRTEERFPEWRVGRPDDSNSFLVGTHDKLAGAGDQALGAHAFSRGCQR